MRVETKQIANNRTSILEQTLYVVDKVLLIAREDLILIESSKKGHKDVDGGR